MLVNPPRERPSASRLGLAADFLSFDPAPCVQLDRRDNLLGHISGELVASSGGVLVSTDYPGVDPDRPLRTLGLVGVAAQLIEDKHPRAIAGPAAMPVVDRFPMPVVRRYVTPRQPAAGPPEHPVDHRAVIGPTATPLWLRAGQQGLQPSPFLIGQIVSIQHADGLPQPPVKIRGTRSSGRKPAPEIIGHRAL